MNALNVMYSINRTLTYSMSVVEYSVDIQSPGIQPIGIETWKSRIRRIPIEPQSALTPIVPILSRDLVVWIRPAM